MSGEVRQPEAVVARLRPHGRALFWPSIALLPVAAGTTYAYTRFEDPNLRLAVIGGGLLLAVLVFVFPLLSWLARNYTITTRRLVLRSGVFTRVRQELLHSRGYDVSVRQSGLQRMFRSGDVRINAGADHHIVLHDVPSADLVQAALHDLMEANADSVAARRHVSTGEQYGRR